MERTLVIVKPDAVQRGLIGEVITRLERRGLKIIAMKMLSIDKELAERHYGEHKGKAFYPPLIRYITAAPVVVMVVEGPCAIQTVRRTLGSTNPIEAAPGTIRADYAIEISRNLVHGSDGPESASREIALYFCEDEILAWDRDVDRWVLAETVR